jgi:hypothetical protein
MSSSTQVRKISGAAGVATSLIPNRRLFPRISSHDAHDFAPRQQERNTRRQLRQQA